MSTGPQAAGEETPLWKNITFVMPFEEDADTPNRLYKLIYWRFKHIIETKINYINETGPAAQKNPNPILRNGKKCQFRVSAVVTRKNAQLLDVILPIYDS